MQLQSATVWSPIGSVENRAYPSEDSFFLLPHAPRAFGRQSRRLAPCLVLIQEDAEGCVETGLRVHLEPRFIKGSD